jgi:cobalamin biosynthesis Mg chelatase CobN
MHVTLDIPDELASALVPQGQDPARVALVDWGLEAFRERRLSEYQLRTLLGLESRWDLHALFKERKVDMYTVEEFEKDLATNEELRKNHPVGSRA